VPGEPAHWEAVYKDAVNVVTLSILGVIPYPPDMRMADLDVTADGARLALESIGLYVWAISSLFLPLPSGSGCCPVDSLPEINTQILPRIADGLDCFRCRATDENCYPAEELLILRVKKVLAPVESRLERVMPFRQVARTTDQNLKRRLQAF
jgi:hypothetical protein